MNFLLDTNVISELRKNRHNRVEKNVALWAESINPEMLYISVMTVYEIDIGILRLERKDRLKSSLIRKWFDDQVISTFSGRIVPVDTEICLRCAALNVPDPKPFRDSLIAATALVRNMILVTRNVADFKGLGLQLVNPWNSPDIFAA